MHQSVYTHGYRANYDDSPFTYVPAGIKAEVLIPESADLITTLDSSAFNNSNFPQRMTLQIPSELIQKFVNMSGRNDGGVRAVSAVYYNIEELLPPSRPQMNE